MEKGALWRKNLVARYRENDICGWRSEYRAAREGSSVMRTIARLGNGEGRIRTVFKDGLRLLVGKGNKISF